MGQSEIKKGILKEKISLSYFEYKYIIGRGGFGKVWKVFCRKTNKEYAMKVMSKVKIIHKKSVNSIISEKMLLSRLHHPFLVNMNCTFQDIDNLYLVMDLLTGGDLRYHVGINKRFNHDQTKFFIACIILGLKYIHSNSVIHRDIKPENLVLEENGYVRITDFGIAKIQHRNNKHETSGTPGYMAPEVLCAQNHTYQVDFFALGVIGYEFMKGCRPYHGKNRFDYKQDVLSKQVQINPETIPEGWDIESVDFINSLIQRKSEKRLGLNGISDLQNHPWFNNFNWLDLFDKKIQSPFVPKKGDNYNKKYCEGHDKIGQSTEGKYFEYKNSENYPYLFENYTFTNKIVLEEINKSIACSTNLSSISSNNSGNNNCLSIKQEQINNSNKDDFTNKNKTFIKLSNKDIEKVDKVNNNRKSTTNINNLNSSSSSINNNHNNNENEAYNKNNNSNVSMKSYISSSQLIKNNSNSSIKKINNVTSKKYYLKKNSSCDDLLNNNNNSISKVSEFIPNANATNYKDNIKKLNENQPLKKSISKSTFRRSVGNGRFTRTKFFNDINSCYRNISNDENSIQNINNISMNNNNNNNSNKFKLRKQGSLPFIYYGGTSNNNSSIFNNINNLNSNKKYKLDNYKNLRKTNSNFFFQFPKAEKTNDLTFNPHFMVPYSNSRRDFSSFNDEEIMNKFCNKSKYPYTKEVNISLKKKNNINNRSIDVFGKKTNLKGKKY